MRSVSVHSSSEIHATTKLAIGVEWSALREDIRTAWPGLIKPLLFLICLAIGGRDQLANIGQRWPPTGEALQSHLATWDSGHYLHLSFNGYAAGDNSCAFYPLWPMVLRPVYWITGGRSAWPAFMLAVSLSSVAYLLFGRLVRTVCGEEVARTTIWLHAAAPGALFLSTLYSEPLFFLLMIALFLAREREQYKWAAVGAFFLPLTKAIGVFALAPLVWQAWRKRSRWQAWAICAVPLLGYAAYFGLMALWTGNPFEGFAAQKHYPAQPSIAKIFDVVGFGKAFFAASEFHGMLGSMLDRVFFVLFAATLPFVWKLRREWFWWALLIGVVPATSSSFMSFTRYVVMVFPVFVVWAKWLSGPGKTMLFWYYVALGFAVQIYLTVRFINFEWAG